MPITPSERDAAESLFISSKFGNSDEKVMAKYKLEIWAKRSEEHQEFVDKLEKDDHFLEMNITHLRTRYERYIDSPILSTPTPRKLSRNRFFLPASIFSIGLIFMALWKINPVLSVRDSVTEIGQQKIIDLVDGSQVILNTDSAGCFTNRLFSREWTLERGEASFSVKHNALRPFKVFAGQVNITDIGTVFTVRQLANGVSIAVLEGVVGVKPYVGAVTTELKAHQALRTTDGSISIMNDEFDKLVSWRTGRIDFDGTPLTDVIREIQRYRVAPIILGDTKLGAIRISGGFSNREPDQLLKTLPQVIPISLVWKKDGTVIINSLR